MLWRIGIQIEPHGVLYPLPGRAGEELIYGGDEVSTVNQRRLVLARRIVTKLVVASAMTDSPAVGPRTISSPRRAIGDGLKQIILPRVRLSFICDACSSTIPLPGSKRDMQY